MKLWLTIVLLLLVPFLFAAPIKVIRVIDGDTFEIETGERVRLLGINTPELNDFYGREAKEYLQTLVEGKLVTLEADHISSDKDIYNRLLRYVILNGSDINKQLILDGYAFAYTKYGFDKEKDYVNAQNTSEKNRRGMWLKEKINQTEQVRNEVGAVNKSRPIKIYILAGLILTLLAVGIYYYSKK
jgi:micrococcal nuclease